MTNTGPCYECEQPVSYDASNINLHALECPHCGERACATCQDCGNEIAPLDLLESKSVQREGYTAHWCEQCAEDMAELATRHRKVMAYEQWCDDEGDLQREECRS
jgi:predicted RNA-binding Zn-ribbon protein involved in translation (DUF1610 family)